MLTQIKNIIIKITTTITIIIMVLTAIMCLSTEHFSLFLKIFCQLKTFYYYYFKYLWCFWHLLLTKSVERAQETMARETIQTRFKPVSLEPCELTARPHLQPLTFSVNKHRSNWTAKQLLWKSIISYLQLVSIADGSTSATPSTAQPLLHHALHTHTSSHTWSGTRGGTLL